MRRFVHPFALLVGLLLLAGLVAACNGDGEAKPTPTTEVSETTPTEPADAEPTVARGDAQPFDSFHYTVDMEFTVSELGEEEGALMSAQVEGDFVSPDSHALTSTFGFAGLSASQEVVIIGDDAWFREGSGDWTETSRFDPDVIDAIGLSSADPDFLNVEELAEGISALESEAETRNGVDTRRYHIPKEALETLAGLLGEDFLEDTAGLEEFEMTVWLEEETGALVRVEFTAAASPEVFGEETGLTASPDATVSISMVINVTQINDPDMEIEPPI